MMLKQFIFILLFLLTQLTQISAQTAPPTAKDFFDKGFRLMQEQKFNESLDAFRQSARLDATQAATQANIGAVLLALNRIGESIAPFREAVRLVPNEASFRLALCQSLSLTENHAEAISQCEEGMRLKSDAPEPHIALIMALRAAKRQTEVSQKIAAALQKFSDNEILLNVSAEVNEEAGDYNRAVEIYETLARLRPNSAVYQVRLAENYLRLERDSEAIAAARKALQLEPKHPLAHFYLGRVYFELGQHEEAVQNFQKASEIDTKFAEAFYYLGVAESQRSKLDKSIAALRQAVALSPDNFFFNRELGKRLEDDKRSEEAVEFLRKADKINPNDFETKVGLGLTLTTLTRFGEALETLTKADRMKPGNQDVQMFLSVTRARQQSATQIEAMKQHVANNPKDVKVRQHLTEMLVYLRRTKEAKVALEELIPMLPKTNKNLTMVGVLYTDLGMDEKAVEYHRKAIEIDPHYVIYLNLAFNLEKLGRTAEIQEAFKKALELKPDSIGVLKPYADFLRDQGKRQEALAMYKRAVEAEPTNSPSLFNLSILYAKTGNLAAAKQYYEMLKTVDAAQAKVLDRLMRLK
jgi:superkiller protein 3